MRYLAALLLCLIPLTAQADDLEDLIEDAKEAVEENGWHSITATQRRLLLTPLPRPRNLYWRSFTLTENGEGYRIYRVPENWRPTTGAIHYRPGDTVTTTTYFFSRGPTGALRVQTGDPTPPVLIIHHYAPW